MSPRTICISILFCVALSAAPSTGATQDAQAPAEGTDPGLNSPQSTMFTFLGGINNTKADPDSWANVLKCLDLTKVNQNRGKEIATDLLGVINRLGEVRASVLPDEEDVSAGNLTEFLFFPQEGIHDWVRENASYEGNITLVKLENGNWRFSAGTIAGISLLYNNLEALDRKYGMDERDLSLAKKLKGYMPEELRGGQLLSIAYWQWLLLILLILIGVVVDHFVRISLNRNITRILSKIGFEVQASTVKKAMKPLGMAAMALIWLLLLPMLGMPDTAILILMGAVRIFAVLAFSMAAWRLTDVLGEIMEARAALTENKFDDMLIPLLRKTTKVVIVVFGSLYALSALNVEVGPLVAALGLGGFGFAFAAKDTIENFFGSIAVLLDRPFDVGDVVSVGGVEGSVEEIGFRSTRIRTFYNSQVTLPNATLVRATVDNFGRREFRRFRTTLGVEYGTSPDQLLAFTSGIRELLDNHPLTRKENFVVHLNEFGGSSLNILMQVFFITTDWTVELQERERLMLDIMRLADQLGVNFAFPTQTLHMFKEDSSLAHQPETLPGSEAEQHANALGMETASRILENQKWYLEREPEVEESEGTNPDERG